MKGCEEWLLPGAQRMGAPGGGWEKEGDPVPMKGIWVSASGPGRQQAWSPEPFRTLVLRSDQEGQVMFDSQQGRSLVLVTAWFVMGSVFLLWKLQPSLSESILKEPNCLRFHFKL